MNSINANVRIRFQSLICYNLHIFYADKQVNLCAINFENGTKLDEVSVFTPGDDVTVFKIDDIRCGLAICNDAVFDEFVKIYRKLGTELFFVPAAYDIIGGDKYSLHYYWDIVHKARAFDNQMFVAAISGARNEKIKDYVLYGHTMLIDPQGKVLEEAGVNEEILYHEIGKNSFFSSCCHFFRLK